MNKNTKEVFISYSTKDTDIAFTLLEIISSSATLISVIITMFRLHHLVRHRKHDSCRQYHLLAQREFFQLEKP